MTLSLLLWLIYAAVGFGITLAVRYKGLPWPMHICSNECPYEGGYQHSECVNAHVGRKSISVWTWLFLVTCWPLTLAYLAVLLAMDAIIAIGRVRF